MIREFFLGFIKIHILYHAAEGPIYGAEMARELSRHGYDISPGTLYPTLHGLERSGYLISEKRVEAGRRRKYYRITSNGEEALAEARVRIRELVEEVLG
ncbi:MAG: PadR family transcriptional regulator [Anaerolineae bacterium]|jgi:DNA-binding PadR family transcriptional regulator|nr:PadR family transcriptional regulator [Anaerolineae bacterium]MDH7473193.1 PadR family transcriptional regulator [Anaerolineae bacterium]